MLANGSVILNGSAFFYDYTDLQVSKLENNAGVITNAADATIFGAEVELLAQATDRWRFNVGLSFLNAEFDQFLTEDPSNPQLGTIDLDGNNLPRSPEFSANVGTDYTVPVGTSGDLSFRVDYQYQDESFFTTFNRQLSAQDAFSLLNARVSYIKNDGSWGIAAFIRNALDEDYFLNILESGVETGKPLSDMREYVGTMRAASEHMGGLPPIDLATLRDKMVGLAVEVGDGAVWANASRSRMAHSLSLVGDDRLADGFQIGNMIPTVIDDDLDAARARNRKTLRGYVALPNYRNYWVDAGYGDEMAAVAAALEAGDDDGVVAAMSDRWLDDCTLSGPVGRVREGVEAWFDAGVTNPTVVPSSISGGQAKAMQELFDAYT